MLGLSRRQVGRLALGTTFAATPFSSAFARKRKYFYLLKEIPEFEAPLIGGGILTQETFSGKWSILDFWGLWCGPCLRDSAFVATLSKKMSEHSDLAYQAIHTGDNYGKWGSVETYFEEKQYSYPVALDKKMRVLKRFKLNSVPSYLIVGPDRVVRGIQQDSFVDAGQDAAEKFLQLFIDLHDGKITNGGDGS